MLLPGRCGAECFAELLVVLLGHAEQIGHHQQRERPGVGRQELTLAVGDELVDVAVGQPPHEVLVLLQPLGRQQPASSDRASVWYGGSIVTMCSNIGISVRCSSSCAQMSSPSGTNGIGVNGPVTATQDE